MREELFGIGSRVKHARFGDGVVVNLRQNGYQITFMEHGSKTIRFDESMEAIEAVEQDTDLVSLLDVEIVVSKLLQKWADINEIVALGEKWTGGKMIVKPNRSDLQPKEFPIDQFFHKIVMIRDRMRCLEQKVNASKGLTDEEKIDIQQYITRCYGSLTSFNMFFKNKEQWFVGEKIIADI